MTAPAPRFREDRPAKSTIRNLVKIGALPPLPYGKNHLTRDIVDAAQHVADALAQLRKNQSDAGLPPKNFSSEAAWEYWCEKLHPRTLVARAATAKRLASRAYSREARQFQGDLFAADEVVVA